MENHGKSIKIANRESKIENRGSRIANQYRSISTVENRGSRIEDGGSRIDNRELSSKSSAARSEKPASRIVHQGLCIGDREGESRIVHWESRIENRGPESRIGVENRECRTEMNRELRFENCGSRMEH